MQMAAAVQSSGRDEVGRTYLALDHITRYTRH
jgi:hypothetical protein